MSTEKLAGVMKFVTPEPFHKVDNTVLRDVLCGDCGTWPSDDPNRCPKCGGPAVTLVSMPPLDRTAAARRLAEYLTAATEIRVEARFRYWRCAQGHARRIYLKPIEPIYCLQCRLPMLRHEGREMRFLDDVMTDEYAFPPSEMAAVFVGIALGDSYTKTCRRCLHEKHDGSCEEAR